MVYITNKKGDRYNDDENDGESVISMSKQCRILEQFSKLTATRFDQNLQSFLSVFLSKRLNEFGARMWSRCRVLSNHFSYLVLH